MTNSTTRYIIVTPRFSRIVTSIPAGAALAARLESHAQNAHGDGAGADCYLVINRNGQYDFRGVFAGRRLIGASFGCSAHILDRAQREIV